MKSLLWRNQLLMGLIGWAVVLTGNAAADIGDVFYVDKNNASGVENGLSWATAATTIEQGIEIARRSFGGEVWVAAGVYDEEREGGTLRMRAFVDLYGGFSGTENTRNQRDWEANITVIDGSVANAGQPAANVVTTAANARLDGFTIRGGRGQNGAGLLNNENAPVIANCTFADNQATRFGGAVINIDDANAQFLNCVFEGNIAGESGGAIANTSASPEVRDCVFIANTAVAAGGAIFNTPDSNAFITNSTFRENLAENGGAIFSDQANPYIDGCFFFDNAAKNFGGAIFNNNLAEGLLVNSVFARNIAESEHGGAIANQESGLFVLNCTITENVAGENGGGIFSNGRQLLVVNSILWDNEPRQFSIIGADLRVNYSNIDGRMEGTGNINFPPRFRDPANDNFNLQPQSRSVNAGTADPAPEVDILGTPRPQGTGVDMGAYESTNIGTPEPIPPTGCLLFGGVGALPPGPGSGDLVLGVAALLLLLGLSRLSLSRRRFGVV